MQSQTPLSTRQRRQETEGSHLAEICLALDGTAIPSLTMNGTGQGCVNQPATPPFTWTAPNFDRLDLGWESYQTDGVRTIHVDDVVISKTQVGCPAN